MDYIEFNIKILGEGIKTDEEVSILHNNLSKTLSLSLKMGDCVKIDYNHKSTCKTVTPDGKFKIGNIYKLHNKREDIVVLLVNIFENDSSGKDLHLAFVTSVFNNPSLLEAGLGFGNNKNEVLIGGYGIETSNTIGYRWTETNGIIDYIYEKPVEYELLKEIDDKEFTEFYKKHVLEWDKEMIKKGDLVENKISGTTGIVNRINESGSIQVQEAINVVCTHDSDKTLKLVENSESLWKPISGYDRKNYDWVLIKYFDEDYECIPTVAEMRRDGKWYSRDGIDIPFEVRYFLDMQLLK